MSLRDEIKTVLSPPHNLFNIINQFEEWSKNQHKELLNEADAWVLQLYNIDAHFFLSFLTSHIPTKNQEITREVLMRTEADGHQALFSAYYAHVAPDYINQEIQEWIAEKLTPEQIVTRFRWRTATPQKMLLSEASCIAIYNYSPRIFETELLSETFIHSHNIEFEAGNTYKEFRTLVDSKRGYSDATHANLRCVLLRRFGTENEQRAEIKRIIETATTWTSAKQQLNLLKLTVDEAELQLLQKRFEFSGEQLVQSALAFLNDIFVKNYIKRELAKATTEAQMEVIATELRNKLNWNRFYDLADSWILQVYDVAPDTCLFLVASYGARIKISSKTAVALLRKVQQRKHREMLRFVYAQLYNQDQWNAALLDVVQSDMPLSAKNVALEDLDCQPRYVYYGQKRAYLADEVASAIYRLSPAYLHTFILHNLAPNTTYPALLIAAEGTADYYRIFREVADGRMWKAEMQALLERDVPADEIESILERYHLNRLATNGVMRNAKEMDARVLKGFMDKYGEAVLPFFERYVRWASEGRLKSLLALDVDRAELLRELTVIARREPQEFANLSHVWALPLYERGANFFESFITRFMGRGNEYVTRQLLTRARADKHTNLYRSLYRLVVRGQEWNKEFAQFINTAPSDDALTEFVELHDIPNWDYTLDDAVAAQLYQRNPDRFSPFILRHLSQQARWGYRANYDKLLKVSASEPEHHLAFLKSLAYDKYWQSQIKTLLESNMTGAAAAERLEAIHPRNTWDIQDNLILHKVLDKYGADVVPYIVTNIQWIKQNEVLMKMLEAVAPPHLFWDAVFQTMNWHGNAGWSYRYWSRSLETLCQQDLSDGEVMATLQMLSPTSDNRWVRYQISEAVALCLYQKYPDAARGFIQRYYIPKFDDTTFFELAEERHDEEMLDFLCFSAMSTVNQLVNSAFPRNPQYYRPNKQSEDELNKISARIIERFESLYQRDPELYVRHVALTLAWWRPFAIWNAEGMVEHNPIYHHISREHIDNWMTAPEAIREVLESPNIFVQLIALNLLRNSEHQLVAQRILENKRIFRQLLLGRARRSTKRLALTCIERAIALNPAFASELLPILEEAADFYGRLALSEEMMISITRIRYALDQQLPLPMAQ